MRNRAIRWLTYGCTAFLGAAALLAADAHAATKDTTYGIAMHGDPALPAGFDHLPYANPDAPKGGLLRIGFQGTFDSLNPFNIKAGSTAQGLIGNVYQTLMIRNFDEPFSLYGQIAKSIETDPERTQVTFRLDPGARFSDGSPITADDVRFTFELLKTRGRPQSRAAYGQARSIETPDQQTVHFDLTGSKDRELPLILALMPVLSRARTDTAHFEESSLAIPTGSGPYIITTVVAGQSLHLKRNPDYWAKDLPTSRGLYNFDDIQIDYYRDPTSLYEAFKAGLLDYREETNPSRWLNGYDFPALNDGRIARASEPLGIPKGLQGFTFNTRRDIFKDVRVREALGLLFDFEWINANLFGGLYTRTKSFFDESELASTGKPANARERALLARWPDAVRPDILAGTWAPPISDGSGRDRKLAERAVSELREAGFVITDGALRRQETGEPLAFEIMVADRAQERLALDYADQLHRIGIEARVRLVDDVQYQRRRQTFDFDMMIGTWLASASPGNEQMTRWGSASANQQASFNLAGASSPAIDDMIGQLLAAQSHEDFVAAVRALDRLLLSGFYVVPLFHASDQWFAYSTRLKRPDHAARYAAPLYGATLDSWWRQVP